LNTAVNSFQDCIDWSKRGKAALCEREKEDVLNEIENANEKKTSKNNYKQHCDANHDCVS